MADARDASWNWTGLASGMMFEIYTPLLWARGHQNDVGVLCSLVKDNLWDYKYLR